MNAVDSITEVTLISDTHSVSESADQTTCITDTPTNTQDTPRPSSPKSPLEITTPTVRKIRAPVAENTKTPVSKVAAQAVRTTSASSSATTSSARRTPVSKVPEKTTPKATPTLAASRNNSITSTPDQKLDIYAFSTSVVIKPKTAHDIYRDSPKPGTNPKYAHVKAKVGSFDNIGFKSGSTPSGRRASGSQDGERRARRGEVKNRTRDIQGLTKAWLQIDASNPNYKPGKNSGKKVVVNHKIDLSHVKPKVGSLANIHYTSKRGNVKYEEYKLDFKERAVSRIDRGLLQKTPIKTTEKLAEEPVTAPSPAPESRVVAAVEVEAQ